MGITNNLGKLSNMITSTGSAVGIGTSSPQSGYILDVKGFSQFGNSIYPNVIRLGDQDTNSTIIQSVSTAGVAKDLTFWNTSERMRITSTGNVGIGTTNYFDGSGYGSTARYLTILNSSASSQIEISTNSTTNDSLVGGFDFINAANAGTSGSGRYGVGYVRGWIANASGTGNTSGGYITFGTKADGGNQSERMRITSAGDVGIGTSSPATRFHVYQNVGSNDLRLNIQNGANNAASAINLIGTNDFGTSYNTILSRTGNNTPMWQIGGGGSVDTMVLYTAGSERARISNNSYGTLLAVGTSTPTNGGSAASWITINGSTAGTYSGGLAFSYNSAAKVYQFWDNNNFYIQNGALGVYLARDAASWSSVSDERLKDVTGNINNAVSSLLTLSTIKHTYKSDNNKIEHLGLIAQEIQEVFPQVVDKYTIKDDETKTEYLSVRYTELVPVLVAAIKELETRIKILENK